MRTWTGFDFSSEILSIILILDFILSFVIIFLERRNPQSTLVWLFVLYIFPLGGIILYLLMSQHVARHRVYRFSRDEVRFAGTVLKNQVEDMRNGKFVFSRPESKKWQELISLNHRYGLSYFTQDNDINIITDGREMFDTLITDIRQAKRTINVQFFILKNDFVGKQLIEELTERAKEGIEVRLLLDAVGSRTIWENNLREFAEAGGKYAFFFKSTLRVFNMKLNYRNHRKIIVIDSKVGYTGGFNIAKEYLGKKRRFGYWRDTFIRMTGGCVSDLLASFIMDWRYASGEEMSLAEAAFSFPIRQGEKGVQIVSSGPADVHEQVKRGFMRMITSAEKSIYIQTPYLVPDGPVLESLKMAAQSGVDVRIMIPSMADHPFVYWATLAYAGELLKDGARIFLYENGFLHSKTITCDGEVSSVGSTNFDIRSFRLNFETNAFIFDCDTAEELQYIFEQDMLQCHELTLQEYRHRSPLQKCRESISILLSDLL